MGNWDRQGSPDGPTGDSDAAPGGAERDGGGRYVVRSQNITAVDGVAPKRFVVIAFDTPEHAKAFSERSDAQAIRAKTTKSRSFLVEGLGQP